MVVIDPKWTVTEILQQFEVPEDVWNRTEVTFGGNVVHPEIWHLARPKIQVQVQIRVTPGSGDSNTLRTLLFIAVAVAAVIAAPYIAPYLVGATSTGWGVTALQIGLAQVGVTVIGVLLINALIPPSIPKQDDNGTDHSQLLNIGANRNAFKPYGTMPSLLGTMRIFPPYAAKPYTELVGADQYLRLLFVLGYREMYVDISTLKLGDTALSSFIDVEYEIQILDSDPDITLFTSDVDEEAVAIQLEGPDTPIVRTTSVDAISFSVDLSAPGGLVRVDKSGDRWHINVDVTIERKLSTEDDSAYVNIGAFNWAANTGKPILEGKYFDLPTSDQYDIRLTRTTVDVEPPNGTDQIYQDDVVYTTFRSIKPGQPVLHPDAALMALRIKATDQLNGTVDNLNMIASSIFPDWDTGSGTWIDQVTNNPASLYRGVLQGRAMARPLADYRINLLDLQDWHDENIAKNRTFNMYRDFTTTIPEVLQDVASAGRARRSAPNGIWSIVRDIAQTDYVQVVSELNSWGFSATKIYPELMHAFRIRFQNEDEGYEPDERLVYDDGYDETNASKFEALELVGVTDPDQIWADARYFIAVSRLRPELYTFSMDVEHLPLLVGSLIAFQHQAILVGLGASRIQSYTISGSDVLTISLDDAMSMDGESDLGVRIRDSDGQSRVFTVENVAGLQLTLTFTGIKPTIDQLAIDDVVVFGVTGKITMDIIVTSIVPGKNISALISCFDAAPGVHTADTGEIPPHDSHITVPVGSDKPIILNIVSDESVLIRNADGSLQSQIVIYLGFVNNREFVSTIETQYKPTDNEGANWIILPLAPADTLVVSIQDVLDGTSYDIRMRYRFLDTTFGEWSVINTHEVIGKTSPPPDVTTFTVVRFPDGTREFSWTLEGAPTDLAGFRIKWRSGTTGADWDTNMLDLIDGPDLRTKVADGLLAYSPWETNQLAAGDYQIAIVAVDTTGIESLNPLYISSSLGDPRIQNALVYEDVHKNGFPGTKTSCYVEVLSGNLVPVGDFDWDDLPATWADWDIWNISPASPITYEGVAHDLLGIILITPLITVTTSDGSGTILIEERHKDTEGGAWSSYAEVADSFKTRHIQVRTTITTPPAGGVIRYQVVMSADTIAEYINDLETSTVSSPAGDLRLPINKAYSLITSVQVAIQGTGAGWTWKLMDRDVSTGPRILIYNGAGVLADATIDADIIGIAT